MMDDEPAPNQPAQPGAPNYGSMVRQGVEAEVKMLPLRYQTELEYQPKFQDLAIEGEQKSATARAQLALDIARNYGDDFVTNQLRLGELADPVGTSIRKELGERILGELKLGTSLDPQLAHDIKQAYRAGRSVRGGGFGDEDAILEAMTMGEAGLRMQSKRFSDAGAFLSGRTPEDKFAATSTAAAGAAPFLPSAPGQVVDPSSGRYAAQFGEAIYGDKLRYNEGMYSNTVNWGINAPNPWMEGLGILAGMIGQVGGAAAGAAVACWVASELYGGWYQPRTCECRTYILCEAPAWFRNFYIKHGLAIAKVLRRFPMLKLPLYPLFNSFARRGRKLLEAHYGKR